MAAMGWFCCLKVKEIGFSIFIYKHFFFFSFQQPVVLPGGSIKHDGGGDEDAASYLDDRVSFDQ